MATLMWRRPLNSTTLAAATHKGLKGVSDRIGAQVGVQVTNKCKVQMIRDSLYNVRKLPQESEGEKRKKRRGRDREHVKEP